MLIGLFSAVVGTVWLSAGVTAAAAVQGDLNGSGTADIADAVLLMRLIGEDFPAEPGADGVPAVSADLLSAADLDRNGFLDARDLSVLLRILTGQDGETAPEETVPAEDGAAEADGAQEPPAAEETVVRSWFCVRTDDSAEQYDAVPVHLQHEDDLQVFYGSEDGSPVTGTLVLGSEVYFFGADGVCMNPFEPLDAETFALIESAPRSAEPLRTVEIWDNENIDCFMRTEFPEKLYSPLPRYRISDADISILERFAAEHFTDGMTVTQKLWITHQWIHGNVTYTYRTDADFWTRSYADAVFQLQLGQCIHYNGAMADMLAYLGFDVYMVKGKVDGRNQHFWTEVLIDGQRYYIETGNKGKNGDWRYFFEPVAG